MGLPERVRYPIVAVTSLPLSATAAREAAALFAEISRKPVLPGSRTRESDWDCRIDKRPATITIPFGPSAEE